jgi:hypothetical protein
MDIKNEFSTNQMVLLMMSNVEYNEAIVDVMKKLSGNVCYVTTNKTFDSLTELFEKKKVDLGDVVFIDAISKTIKKAPSQADSVYYVSSPGALTELSLVIEKFLRHEFDYLIFDSINNLSIYNKMPICAKFMTSLGNKIKKTKTKAVFYALGDKSDDLAKHVGMFVDKVVDVGGKSSGDEVLKKVENKKK